MSRKAASAAKTLWQVRASWRPNWTALSPPFEDRAEAWAEYHARQAERSQGWTSAGGVEIPGPRLGYVVELIEYNTGVSGEKVLERSDRDPADRGRTRTIDVAALLDAARGRSGDAEAPAPCVECGYPSTSYTPGGLAVCDDHRSES